MAREGRQARRNRNSITDNHSPTVLTFLQVKMKALKANPKWGAGNAKQILIDGVWQVPPKERPKGWEKMGGREKDA